MQSSAARETYCITDIEHAARVTQQCARMFSSYELQKALWTDARPAAKQALKMSFAQADVFSDVTELGLVAEILLEITNGGFDNCVIGRHGFPLG